jgi:hypothetical protein
MIGVAAAVIVLGLIMLFIVPWVGIVVGVVGVLLLVLHLVALARARPKPPAEDVNP